MTNRRVVKSLTNMEIDEISLVDRGANQHSTVTIAKRAPEEDHMPKLYLEDGSLLTDDNAEEGLTVKDEEGNEYVLEAEAEEVEENKELAEVGKSAFFKPTEEVAKSGKSFSEEVMESISKAFDDDERDKIIAKALDELAEENKRNAEIAKSERDLRLTREYISKADEYGVPGIPSEELGPVLYRMAETMSYDDCAVIAKALEVAGAAAEALYDEIGSQGGGANSDVMDMVNGYAEEQISKAEGVSKADTVVGVFDQSPEAYEQYLSDQRTARF